MSGYQCIEGATIDAKVRDLLTRFGNALRDGLQ